MATLSTLNVSKPAKPHIPTNNLETLPSHLEATILDAFDKLVAGGEILYASSTPERIVHNSYRFEFRICSALVKKQLLARDDPGRTTAVGPFMDTPEELLVAHVGPGNTHQLICNKYCALRPMLILHTTNFALQSSDLNAADLSALWAVLRALGSRYMAIYNCGVDAGASQGHKHMQIFPRPDHELFPDLIKSSLFPATALLDIPFKHFGLLIQHQATAEDVYHRYLQLLGLTHEAHSARDQGTDYNVILTTAWICLIPRRYAGKDGVGANAAGMLGLVWVKTAEERAAWTTFEYTNFLAFLGIPQLDRSVCDQTGTEDSDEP